MAKWDSKDERWLVEDRKDGHNVNGWHWQEQQRLSWSKKRLAELCTGLTAGLDSSLGHARITGLKDATGEAVLTTRKAGKKLGVFDLVLTLSWEGTWSLESTKVTGTIKVTEFTSLSDPEDFCFVVSADGSGAAQDNLVRSVQGLQPDMIKRLLQYSQELGQS